MLLIVIYAPGSFNEKILNETDKAALVPAFLAHIFLYLYSAAGRWQNNPASILFGKSAIIQERQFIIRLALKRQQPSQLGPLRRPVTHPVSLRSTSLRLEAWWSRPKAPATAAARRRGRRGQRGGASSEAAGYSTCGFKSAVKVWLPDTWIITA